jgi:CheY-like chemotaxis protein
MMRRHGVDDRSQANVLGKLLNLSSLQARRKLQGQVSWSFEEVLATVNHFGESIDRMVAQIGGDAQRGGESAVLEIGQERLPCHLWIGPSLAQQEGPGLVAVREGESWYVSTHSALNARDVSAPRYGVDRLEVIDPSIANVRVAILDDDPAVAIGFREWFEAVGYHAESFTTEDELAHKIEGFDAFIIDLVLGEGRTCKSLVEKIRQVHPNAPVLLLTGMLDSGAATAEDEATLVRVLKVQVNRKPTSARSLANAIQAQLGSWA